MRKEYIEPQMEMITITKSDVITTSYTEDLTGMEGLISNDGTGWSAFY